MHCSISSMCSCCNLASNCSLVHTHPFNGPFSGTTQVSQYQKGKTNLDFTKARGSEWQWHQLGRMQICNSLQTDNHASTPPLSFLQAGCSSCRSTNSIKALKAILKTDIQQKIQNKEHVNTTLQSATSTDSVLDAATTDALQSSIGSSCVRET